MPASDRAFRCRPVVLDENGENDWVAAWTLDRAEPISDGLLAAGGHYSTLYNTYFRHQSLAYVEESRREFGGDRT